MSIHISLIFEKNNNENKGFVRKWRNAMFEIRTDLAIEEKTENRAEQSVAGVSCREWREPSSMVKMTEVKILDEHGARALRKPVGTYLTLEAKTMGKNDED